MSQRYDSRAVLILCGVLTWALTASAGGPQDLPLPPASSVVEPHVYVSLAPVPRGRSFELALVANILPGFHINAHEVSLDYLIPTTLEAQAPTGIRVRELKYPPGTLRRFDFSPTPLRVYEGRATLRMRLAADADAPLGPQAISLTLRYQACNQQVCLPPVKLHVTAELEIASAGTPSRLVNSAIFSASPSPKDPSPH